MLETSTQSLNAEDFFMLYSSVGWNPPPIEQIEKALCNSILTICIKDNNKPIGMGRLIGDGAMSYMVKDVAILPSYQKKGIGRKILETMMSYIKENTPENQMVCVELFSSFGKEPFYEKFSFDKKPDGFVGHGMMAMVSGKRK